MPLLNYLSQTKMLWRSFWVTLALTICFGIVMLIGQFGIIDESYIAEDIRTHIEAMTPKQREIHAWMTGTLDVFYPFAYAAFFIGIAIKYFGRYGIWLAIPSFLVVPADLTEGFAQIMLLQGNEDYMGLKTTATKTKLTFYLFGLAGTIIGLLKALRHKLKSNAG